MQLCNGSPVVLDATFIIVLRIKSQKDDPEFKEREKDTNYRHGISSTNMLCEKSSYRGSTSTKYEKRVAGIV